MEVSEDELRAMVRDAIARQSRPAPLPARPAPLPAEPVESLRPHASFGRLTLVTGGDSEGQCLIEPSVRCNHCGYCLSLGH